MSNEIWVDVRKDPAPKYDRVVAAAGELIAAVLDAGLSLEAIPVASHLDVYVFNDAPDVLIVTNVHEHWNIRGPLEREVTFAPADNKERR